MALVGVGLWLFISNFGLVTAQLGGWNRYSRISEIFQALGINAFRSELTTNLLFIVSLALIWVLYQFSRLHDVPDTHRTHIRIISAVIACLIVVGNIAEKSDYIFGGPFRLLLFIASLIKWFAWFGMLSHGLSLLYWHVLSRNTVDHYIGIPERLESKYWIFWVIIMLAWMPYMLLNFPGVVTTDGFWQIRQVKGVSGITDHHPVMHTLLLWLMHQISSLLGVSTTITVFFYVLVQAFFLSSIYAFTVDWLRRRGVNTPILIMILGYYALTPIHGFNATVLSKDYLSGGFLLLASIWLFEFLEEQPEGRHGFTWRLFGVCILVIAGLLRNNVFHAMVVTMLIVLASLLLMRRDKKMKDILTLCVVLVVLFSKGTVLHVLGIPGSPQTESLSMPIQQIARTITRTGEIPEEIREDVERFFTVDELKTLYDPYISDPVKFTIAAKGGDTKEVLHIWKVLGKKHPLIFLDSLILSNFGYWYPQLNFSSVLFPHETEMYQEHGILVPFDRKGMYASTMFAQVFQFIPILNLLVGIGFMCFLGFIACDMSYLRLKNRYILLVYLPCFLTFGTLLVAAPMTGSHRYAHFLFSTIPFLILIPFLQTKRSISAEEQG